MRLNTPRIAPLADQDMDAGQRAGLAAFFERDTAYNIFRTMGRKPRALDRFLKWGNYILSRDNSLPAREREIAILRTGFNCGSGYEWAQHAAIGKRCGLSDAEIGAIKLGSAAVSWRAADAALLDACDDLTGDQFISDPHWAALAAHFSTEQCMDLVYTVGQYTLVSMLLNSFGVPLDPGLTLDPDLDRRA